MRPALRNRSIGVSLLAILALAAGAPARAIVVHHEREEQLYRDLGERHPEAVRILPDGSGVLVAPRWVLTAAHVARGVSNRNPRVEIKGRTVGISRIFLHPGWSDMGPHDVALLKLQEPVEGVTPARLYSKGDEVGRVVTFVGRGDFGTGLTGPQKADGVKRGSTNRVEEADDDWLFFTFDEGEGATALEGVSGPGDSGGPALLEQDGTTYTLGVSVFSDGGGKGPGRYGVREGYTRVSTHRDWIEGILAGKGTEKGFAPGEGPGRTAQVSRRAGPRPSGGGELPQSPAGKLVADYLAAYNSNDNERMSRFIASSYGEGLRGTRTDAEHLAFYRRLYDELFGPLEISQVRDVTADAIVILFDTARGTMAEIRFEVAGTERPKIDGLRVAQVEVSMR